MSTPSFAAIAPGNLAVITGAASGIGLAAARAFAARGMRIAMIDRPGVALDAAAAAIDGATPYGVDVADSAAMRELATQIDPASVLMNNAGVGHGGDVFAGVETWHHVIDVNLMGVLHGVHAFAQAMVEGDAPGSSSTRAPSRVSPSRPATPPTTSARQA